MVYIYGTQADRGFPGIPEDYETNVKMPILRESGGSPENYQQIIKIFKIGYLGGPLENCQKIVLGRLKIVQKLSKYCPGTTFL